MDSTKKTLDPNSCKARIKSHFESRRDELKRIFEEMRSQDEKTNEAAYEEFCDYGLSFGYVSPGTFEDQRRGYFRYQISWGGPSEEFRFFCDENRKPVRIEFWFMDWFDGAKKILRGTDEGLLLDVWQWFDDCGSVESEYTKALEEAE